MVRRWPSVGTINHRTWPASTLHQCINAYDVNMLRSTEERITLPCLSQKQLGELLWRTCPILSLFFNIQLLWSQREQFQQKFLAFGGVASSGAEMPWSAPGVHAAGAFYPERSSSHTHAIVSDDHPECLLDSPSHTFLRLIFASIMHRRTTCRHILPHHMLGDTASVLW